MKKSLHKIPASLMQIRINQKVKEQLSKIQDDNHSEFRRGYETASKDVEGLYKPKVEEQKQQLLDQAKRHQKRVEELKATIETPITQWKMAADATPRQHSGINKSNLTDSPQYFFATLGTKEYSGWIVQNWRRGWLWLSNWMFAAIAWVSVYGLPQEFIELIPEANQKNFIPVLSALGILCRFIDQNRKKSLPLVTAGEADDNRT